MGPPSGTRTGAPQHVKEKQDEKTRTKRFIADD